MCTDNIIEMHNIHKRFGGIIALKDINFSVKKNSIHGIVGENGAGKSTLIKILTGLYKKDSGNIILNGKQVEIIDLHHSQSLGIALIPQELSLVPYFSVAENIYLGDEPLRDNGMFIDKKLLNEKAKILMDKLKINLDPRVKAGSISVSQQQMTIIAKAMSQNAQIIIMDEPTARLGHEEVEQLLSYIKFLRSQGKTIIYISHRLNEIFEVCDCVTVLRDGETVATKKIEEIDEDEMISLMVNRKTKQSIRIRKRSKIGDEVLRVEGLKRKSVVKNINFSVKQGEVLGIFGLVGAGRTETIRALLGLDVRDKGKIYLNGKVVDIKNYKTAVRLGFAYVPEERRNQGVVLGRNVYENVSLTNLNKYSHIGFINQIKERNTVSQLVQKLRVRPANINLKVSSLSGGNQQKVVLAKWMAKKNKVFILDEPTRGIDVNAKTEIYRLINEIADEGAAIIMISSEIPEIQSVCDRVLVMKEGQITAELKNDEIGDAETILRNAI